MHIQFLYCTAANLKYHINTSVSVLGLVLAQVEKGTVSCFGLWTDWVVVDVFHVASLVLAVLVILHIQLTKK